MPSRPPAQDNQETICLDSDDSDYESEFEGDDIQLGLADGPLEVDDESNPLVSRIGGRAAWLPMRSPPPKQVAICGACQQDMQLLVQIFAPLEESANDRCLMVFGCARPQCQRTDSASSLRVIRTLKHNPRWAAKLEKQRLRREAKEKERKERQQAAEKLRKEQEERSKVNPFATSAHTASPGMGGGLGGVLFGGGAADANPFATTATNTADAAQEPNAKEATQTVSTAKDHNDDDYSDSDSEDEEEDEAERAAEEKAIKEALSSDPNLTSSWVTEIPKYPALYLNTIPEPASSTNNKLTPSEVEMMKNSSAAKPGFEMNEEELSNFSTGNNGTSTGTGNVSTSGEGYEKMFLDAMDDVFEKFLKRVSVEPRQVVRYGLGAEGVAFHGKGETYRLLWPPQSQQHKQEGGARKFDTSHIPKCPRCGADRRFEAQLMPNLINLLKVEDLVGSDGQLLSAKTQGTQVPQETSDGLSDDLRRKLEIERVLGRKLPNNNPKNNDSGSTDNAQPKADSATKQKEEEYLDSLTGLVWSTAFVFTCSKDCCLSSSTPSSNNQTNDDECWAQEIVLAQFEDED